MKGFKTFATNAVVLILSGLEYFGGIDITEADETAAVAGVLAVVGIVLRFMTKTAVFEKE